MFQRNKKHARILERSLAGALCALATLGAGGCEDYAERRDTLTLGVGDSVAFNKAAQTINRWPAAAREDRWLSDGERARISQSRYRRRAVPSPKTLDKGGAAEMDADIIDKAGTATTGK